MPDRRLCVPVEMDSSKEYYYRHLKNCAPYSSAVGVKRAASVTPPDDKEWQAVMSFYDILHALCYNLLYMYLQLPV